MRSSHVLKRPEHPSYRAHRRQFWLQILLPVLLAVAAFVVALLAGWIAVMDGRGEVGRWAAISTMWLLIPVMIAMLVLLAVLITAILLAARLGTLMPEYTYRAQRIAARAAGLTRGAAAMVRRPALAVRELGNAARARWRRLRERV